MFVTIMGCGSKEESLMRNVVVHTSVTPGGQFVQSITGELDTKEVSQISKSDYTFIGKATGWMNKKEESFEAEIEEVVVQGNTIELRFKEFPKKYFYVTNWEAINQKNPAYSMYSDQVVQVETPIADDFETYEEDITYHLFVPQNKSKQLPIVLVFHGFSDTNNLLAYRTSTNWAGQESQEKYPCIVMSPVIDDASYFDGNQRDQIYEKIHTHIQSMIQEGMVDEKRVYVMGNSFGGMATFEFSEKYPDFVSAALPLCPALNYSETVYKQVDQIVNLPIWIAHAKNDNTIQSTYSQQMYDALLEKSANRVQLKIYSDEEMNAAGGSSNPNSTYSYHHVELAVMEDEAYAKWLFSQTK